MYKTRVENSYVFDTLHTGSCVRYAISSLDLRQKTLIRCSFISDYNHRFASIVDNTNISPNVVVDQTYLESISFSFIILIETLLIRWCTNRVPMICSVYIYLKILKEHWIL